MTTDQRRDLLDSLARNAEREIKKIKAPEERRAMTALLDLIEAEIRDRFER